MLKKRNDKLIGNWLVNVLKTANSFSSATNYFGEYVFALQPELVPF